MEGDVFSIPTELNFFSGKSLGNETCTLPNSELILNYLDQIRLSQFPSLWLKPQQSEERFLCPRTKGMFLTNCGYFCQLRNFPRNDNLSIEGYSLSERAFDQSLQQLPPACGCFYCWESGSTFLAALSALPFLQRKWWCPLAAWRSKMGQDFISLCSV